jgi:hypothetical protein
MGINAVETLLGPARVWRWTVGSEVEYLASRRRELAFLEGIEAVLSNQLGRECKLGPPLVPERQIEPAKEKTGGRG